MIRRHILTTTLAASAALVACLASPVPTFAQRAPSSGIVVSVSGDVVVERSGSQQAVAEGFVLMGGDRVIVRSGARCSGFTPQGTEFELDGPSELQIPSGAESNIVDSVTSWIRMQLADWIGESKRRPLTTRGSRDWGATTDAPMMILPAQGGAVRPSRMELCWGEMPGVDRYLLTVAPALGDEIVRTALGSSATLEELEPGAEYVWKVTPDIEAWTGTGRWREFRVLEPEEETQLDEALIRMDDLEAGVLLLSVGLHGEAILHLDSAVNAGTGGRSARLWRSQALADCGLYREAYEDLLQLRGDD
jgi:hypothetical protein